MAIEIHIDILGINCQGIKSNFKYINYLFNNECDFLFVCDYWLKLCDLVKK